MKLEQNQHISGSATRLTADFEIRTVNLVAATVHLRCLPQTEAIDSNIAAVLGPVNNKSISKILVLSGS